MMVLLVMFEWPVAWWESLARLRDCVANSSLDATEFSLKPENCTKVYLRPYTRESTASRPICEVKHVLAQIVVRWVTTREVWVL
jgi:hypothetical protein